MSEWLYDAFSGGVSLRRANPAGFVLIGLAVVLELAAGPVSRRLPENRQEKMKIGCKFAGLIVCAAGALIATM